MIRHAFGSTGRELPAVGFGTWNLERGDRRQAIRAIHAALDSGAIHVDTAELYGDGRVETLLGEAIDDRRDQVFLVSKVMPANATRSGTVEACERSLARLGTDRLDCYLLHWESPHPLAETIAAFEELVAAGKILSWGVSNFDESRLAEAVRIGGDGRVACNQVLYHLAERSVEHAVLPFCEEHGIALVGYTPFGDGRFPPRGTGGSRVLKEIAAERSVTVRQVALAYLVRRPSLFAIPKSARADRVRENSEAGGVRLSRDEITRIGHAYPIGPRREGVATA